jgi:copper chaperone CopZ
MHEIDLAGVQSVQANADTKTAVVVFDAPATEDLIEAALREINYAPAA